MSNNIKKVDIAGVQVSKVTMQGALQFVKEAISSNQFAHVVTPNPEMVLLAQRNEVFKVVLNSADLAIPDGIGLLMAGDFLNSKITNIPILRELTILVNAVVVGIKGIVGRRFNILPERVPGSDLFNELIRKGEGIKVYLLGGYEDTAQKAKEVIEREFNNINVVGAESGGVISDKGYGENDDEIVKRINNSNPDILVVAFGAPKQDLWISNHKEQLHGIIAMGLGGTLEYVVKTQIRAPQQLSIRGLEWGWRGITQPKRLNRIFNAVVKFPILIAQKKLSMIKSHHDG